MSVMALYFPVLGTCGMVLLFFYCTFRNYLPILLSLLKFFCGTALQKKTTNKRVDVILFKYDVSIVSVVLQGSCMAVEFVACVAG